MKIYISADMEGVAGVVNREQLATDGFEFQQFRKFMTEEVNAAIEGAREAGATEIVVSDSHGTGLNLLMDVLPQDIQLIRSWPRPLGMMEVGWRLREDAWGQGYAREAATASLDLAFKRFGADEVVALTVARNTASWGLMKRLGMQRREDLDFDDPRFPPEDNPAILYSIDRETWAATR